MNTNNNTYTVIYTTIICVLVAAILAFVSQTLKPKQDENEKAGTISQILSAAQFTHVGEANAEIVNFYKKNAQEAFLVNADGKKVRDLDIENAEIFTTSALKLQNHKIKNAEEPELPVYVFKNGVQVIPIYGAGLWGPIWGYIAFEDNLKTIVGTFFDHASETPGLGGKIKDDPAFRAQFIDKKIDWDDAAPFAIVKGGSPNAKENAVDAISGATMTSNGVNAAINVWLGAYKAYLNKSKGEK